MKRSARFSSGTVTLGITMLLWSTSAGVVFAENPGGGNPLRPTSKSTNQVAASNKVTPASAIGTAVRAPEKRTPRLGTPQEQSLLTQRPRSRPTGVSSAAYRHRVTRAPMGMSGGEAIGGGEQILNGTVTVQQKPGDVIDGGLVYEHDAEPMIGDFGTSDCDGCSGGGCNECCLIPCPRIPWDDLTIFGGVQGFTGPKNGGQVGSFGFQEGVNWGAPVPCMNGCLGMQLGARVTQSNLSGAEFTPETRHQTFVTGGLFRRVDCGLQFGVAYDYLSDDWYANTDLTQLRGEVAWVFPCGHELGFWGTASMDEDNALATVFANQIPVTGATTWEGTDLYAFFYRHRFSGWEGATGRLYAGFTGASDGYIGSDLQVPLTCDLALQAGFAYLVPEESKGPAAAGNEEESWNVGISLVWYPGCGSATSKSYFAPLFNVADNGSFMVDRLR